MRKCSCCSSERFKDLFSARDNISGQYFKIKQCLECGISCTDYPEEKLDTASCYPEEYYGEKNARFRPIFEYPVRFFRACRAQYIERLNKGKPGRILDVGCGRGLMLGILAKKGWECFGTETSEVSSQHPRETLGIPVKIAAELKDCHFEENFFDAVTLWHVFEHLKNPLQSLEEIRRILKPEGLLLLEVPNFKSWQASVGQSKWPHVDAPRHLFHYSLKTLERLLKDFHFQTIHVSTGSLEYGPFGIIQSLLNYFTDETDFLFLLMKRKSGGKFKKIKFWKNLFLNIVLLVPLAIVGCFFEVGAVLFNRGGVLRVVARKIDQKDASATAVPLKEMASFGRL